MRRNPLFLGLVRPPMTLGLPTLFWPPVMTLGVLPLIWLQSALVSVALGLLAYGAARLAARHEPRIFELLAISSRSCRRLRTHSHHQGNHYEP